MMREPSLITLRSAIPEPVTVQEAKTQLRIDTDDENGLIASWVIAAREKVERQMRRQLVTAQVAWTLDEIPKSTPANPRRLIILPLGELQSVDAFAYTDTSGDAQTLVENTDFVADQNGDYARLGLASGQSWPATLHQINAVTITFTCGYGAAVDVPEAIKTAIKRIVSEWNENRELSITGTISAETEISLNDMLAPYTLPEYV